MTFTQTRPSINQNMSTMNIDIFPNCVFEFFVKVRFLGSLHHMRLISMEMEMWI